MYGSTIKVSNSDWREARVDDDGNWIVVGPVAEDAAASGSPVPMGGRYDATPRTLDDGDRGEVALDAAGRVLTTGAAAEDAAVAGNPTLVGGRYDATPRTLDDGDAGALALDAAGRAMVAGGVAEDAAAAGNPVPAGGRYDATPRTLDDGDRGEAALDAAGRVMVAGGAAEDAAAAGNPVPIGGRYDATARGLDDGDRGEAALDAAARLKVADDHTVLSATLSLDTAPYAEDDVLAEMQEVANAHYISGGCIQLLSVVMVDKDYQSSEIDLVFMNASGSLGAENAAVNISDADADKVVAIVTVGGTSIPNFDLVNSVIANALPLYLGQIIQLSGTSLYVGAVLRGGTPTYTASGITLKIGIRRL